MANGDIIKEVKALLDSDSTFSTKAAMQLMLTLQVQLVEDVKAVGSQLGGLSDRLEQLESRDFITAEQHKPYEDKLDKIERASIALWVKGNPKLALFILALIVALSLAVDLRQILAQVLGV